MSCLVSLDQTEYTVCFATIFRTLLFTVHYGIYWVQSRPYSLNIHTYKIVYFGFVTLGARGPESASLNSPFNPWGRTFDMKKYNNIIYERHELHLLLVYWGSTVRWSSGWNTTFFCYENDFLQFLYLWRNIRETFGVLVICGLEYYRSSPTHKTNVKFRFEQVIVPVVLLDIMATQWAAP